MGIWVYLLLFTECILLLLAYYILDGDVVAPSIVTLVVFIFATVCYIYNLDIWNCKFGFKAYSLLVLCFGTMVIVEYFVAKSYSIKVNVIKQENCVNISNRLTYIKINYNWILFLVFSVMVAYYCMRIYMLGNVMGATGMSAIGIYKESGEKEVVLRLISNIIRLSSYVYAVVFCYNVFYCKQKVKENCACLFVMAYRMLITFFSGNRIGILTYAVSIFLLMYIFLNENKSGKNIELKRLFRRGIVTATLFIIFFYISRNVVKGRNEATDFLYYITYYCGSPLALMGQIIYTPEICHSPFVGYFGEKTFMELYNDLYGWGIVSEPPAKRLMVFLGIYNTTIGNYGNEYTFLCGPYIDFGYIGTIIFVICFYMFFAYIYHKKVKSMRMTLKRIIFCSIYTFLFSMITLSFYQDAIRDYCRPIYIFYFLFIIYFCRIFVRIKRKCEIKKIVTKKVNI